MSRTVLERFPAGGPRGSWPAEEFARALRDEGLPARVVMDLASDTFLVVVEQRYGTEDVPRQERGTAAAAPRSPASVPVSAGTTTRPSTKDSVA